MSKDVTKRRELKIEAHAEGALVLVYEHVRQAHRLAEDIARLPAATDDDAGLLGRMSELVEGLTLCLQFSHPRAGSHRSTSKGFAVPPDHHRGPSGSRLSLGQALELLHAEVQTAFHLANHIASHFNESIPTDEFLDLVGMVRRRLVKHYDPQDPAGVRELLSHDAELATEGLAYLLERYSDGHDGRKMEVEPWITALYEHKADSLLSDPTLHTTADLVAWFHHHKVG